ncbi:MAG: hypothetical protein O3B74_00515 [Proteobacteria bacterium]|nr:hypothetical protein [Pseudomonadota bacterium]
MAIRVSQRDILDLALECGIQDYPFWESSDRRITSADIDAALESGRLMAPDDARDPNLRMTAEQHAARVAWLIRHAELERTTITIRDRSIVDGNHRFAACLHAGIEWINCVFMDAPATEKPIAA